MNIENLQKKLTEQNINTNSYSLFSDNNGECYVLTKEGSDWLVYYAERGERVDLKSFKNESDACQYFLDLIVSDSTTHNNSIDFSSMNKSWTKIHKFQNFSEFNSFIDWMNYQIKSGVAEEIPIQNSFEKIDLSQEKRFRHLVSGQIWRVVWPNTSFSGIFERIE